MRIALVFNKTVNQLLRVTQHTPLLNFNLIFIIINTINKERSFAESHKFYMEKWLPFSELCKCIQEK